MYESYAWPGDNSLKTEIKTFAKKFKKLLNIIKKSDEKEKNTK